MFCWASAGLQAFLDVLEVSLSPDLVQAVFVFGQTSFWFLRYRYHHAWRVSDWHCHSACLTRSTLALPESSGRPGSTALWPEDLAVDSHGCCARRWRDVFCIVVLEARKCAGFLVARTCVWHSQLSSSRRACCPVKLSLRSNALALISEEVELVLPRLPDKNL